MPVRFSQDRPTLLVRSQPGGPESYLLGHLPDGLREAVVCLLLAGSDLGDLSDEAARLEACSVDSEVGCDWGVGLLGRLRLLS